MGTCRYVAHFGNGSNAPVSDERMEGALREREKYLKVLGLDSAEPRDKYDQGVNREKVDLMRMGDFPTGC